MLYQALLGAWPLDGVDASFVERMQDYAVKAAREGKQQTSWLDPDQRYERGLREYLRRLLDPRDSQMFIDAFDRFARRVALMGALKSLSQVALKATVPGVPDFYQGTELWDLSLVDPDNRRPVDFDVRASMLALQGSEPDWQALQESWPDGRIKLALTSRLLALRRECPALFRDGAYAPIEVKGPARERNSGVCARERPGCCDRGGGSFVRPRNRKRAPLAVGRRVAGIGVARRLRVGARRAASRGSRRPVRRCRCRDCSDAIPVAVLRATCTEPAHQREISKPTLATAR